MARGRRTALRTVQIVRSARRSFRRRPSKRGFLGAGRKVGGGLLDLVERALGKGILYGGVASKFIPTLAPVATLYGEYAGGGIEGLAINEILVKPFLGLPSQLGSIFGPGGLNLGGLFGGGASPGGMASGMQAMV